MLEQLKPFPSNPAIQMQMKLPKLLLQMAWSRHRDWDKHSFTSDVMEVQKRRLLKIWCYERPHFEESISDFNILSILSIFLLNPVRLDEITQLQSLITSHRTRDDKYTVW